ncbi:MAG: transposase [Eubacteriales bacterium]|nr:transposase [Eubacteriales bacterium]
MGYRTIVVDLKSTHPCIPFLKRNTTSSRAVRNTANFLIRNTRSGLRKSPEERTHNETEALHHVFTGLALSNRKKAEHLSNGLREACGSGLAGEAKVRKLLSSKFFSYPTAEKPFLSYEMLDAILKCTGNPCYFACSTQVSQHAIRKTVNSWKAYSAALKEWRKTPGKFTGKPQPPKYLRERETTAHFTNQLAHLRKSEGKLVLSFANCGETVSLGRLDVSPSDFVKCEVMPRYGGYRLLLTFPSDSAEPKVPANPKRVMGIDVGVNNFLAVASNTDMTPFLIDGKWLKSQNQWFNKRRSLLISDLTRGKDSQHSCKQSKALHALSRRRDNLFRDFFYKAAHFICRKAADTEIEVIVIGNNEGIKQEVDQGRTNNQNFVSIPFERMRNTLTCVAMQYGIPVVVREESYTSMASLIDRDAIPTYGSSDQGEIPEFSGSRIKRGLYRSADGYCLNADVNGAANIARKEYPHIFDGITDWTFLTKTVLRITRDSLCGVATKKAAKKPYHRKEASTTVRYRHETRKARRRSLHAALGRKKYVHQTAA